MTKPIKNLQLFNDLCEIEDTLIKRGWCKGSSVDFEGRVCMVGAAGIVCEIISNGTVQNFPVKQAEARFGAILDALGAAIGRKTERVPITMFNDLPKTTFDDVLRTVREAREALL